MTVGSAKAIPPRQLDSLTGLRFLAACHVVLYHMSGLYLSHAPDVVKNLVQIATESVTIFFMLSGFVLAFSYRDRAARQPAPFWWARVARVYPIYLLVLIVALPMFIGHPWQYDGIQLDSSATPIWGAINTHVVAGLACIFLLQAWIPSAVLKWNYPGWSLSAEAFFYALFPSLSYWIARMSPHRLRHVVVAAWLASIGMTACWWIISWQMPPEPVMHAWWGFVLEYNPLIRLPEFIIGIALGFWFMDGPRPDRPGRVATIAALAVLGIWMVHWAEASSHFENSLLLPVYASLILSLAYGEGWLARWLATPKMVELGHASYALYLVHAPVIYLSIRIFPPRVPGTGYLLAALELALTGLVAIQLSLWMYHFVEEPARRAIRRWAAARYHDQRLAAPPAA